MKFNSRKNIVELEYEGGIPIIKKQFGNLKLYANEVEALTMLEGFNSAPKLIRCDGATIVKSYVYGVTVLQLLEEYESKNDTVAMRKLVGNLLDFLYSFYSYKKVNWKYIIHDVNLSNFVVKGSSIYVIDLEEVRLGEAVYDIAQIICLLLTYDPINSQSRQECCKLIVSRLYQFNLTAQQVYDKCVDMLMFIADRRSVKYDVDILNVVLNDAK